MDILIQERREEVEDGYSAAKENMDIIHKN